MKLLSLANVVALSAACGSALLGCAPKTQTPAALAPWRGPTETMTEVVNAVNANNAAVPTLWARHTFEANIVHDGKDDFVNGDGVLLYKSPRGMRLVGEKPFGRLFEIGSTDDRYWLTLNLPEPARMWWGEYANLGKPCVDASSVPIRPDLILQVLGVSTIDTNLLQPPVPTMRFNDVAHAYMFVWTTPLRDRWAAQKEIWYDRVTKLPTRVMLFDEHGRAVLRAKLARHEPVEVPGTPAQRWPKVARSYDLFFPESGSTMLLELDDVVLDRKGVPTRLGIRFPSGDDVEQVIQLDEGCND